MFKFNETPRPQYLTSPMPRSWKRAFLYNLKIAQSHAGMFSLRVPTHGFPIVDNSITKAILDDVRKGINVKDIFEIFFNEEDSLIRDMGTFEFVNSSAFVFANYVNEQSEYAQIHYLAYHYVAYVKRMKYYVQIEDEKKPYKHLKLLKEATVELLKDEENAKIFYSIIYGKEASKVFNEKSSWKDLDIEPGYSLVGLNPFNKFMRAVHCVQVTDMTYPEKTPNGQMIFSEMVDTIELDRVDINEFLDSLMSYRKKEIIRAFCAEGGLAWAYQNLLRIEHHVQLVDTPTVAESLYALMKSHYITVTDSDKSKFYDMLFEERGVDSMSGLPLDWKERMVSDLFAVNA